jgi:hypothetical protein
VEEPVMVTPEVVGHIDPAGSSGSKANGSPEIDSPIALAVDCVSQEYDEPSAWPQSLSAAPPTRLTAHSH